MAADVPALPCTACGDCIRACPEQLSPVAIAQALEANADDQALALGLDVCTGCGDCDRACPSHITLSAFLVLRRDQLRVRAAMLRRAAAARKRYEARNERLQRQAEQRSQNEAQLQQSASSEDAVEAAIARALAKRSAGPAP